MSGEFWFGAAEGGRRGLLLMMAGYPKRKERDESKEGLSQGGCSLPGLLGLRREKEVRAEEKRSCGQEEPSETSQKQGHSLGSR